MSHLSRALRVLGTAGGVLLNMTGGVLAYDGTGERKRPCRACTDFKVWAKKHSTAAFGGLSPVVSKKGERQPNWAKECPVDRIELGQSTWNFLHTMAAYYSSEPSTEQQREMDSFLHTFSLVFPCDECAEHLREWMKDNPPVTTSSHGLSLWLCRAHNEVNVRLGKPEFPCEEVSQRWREGWSDGSCD